MGTLKPISEKAKELAKKLKSIRFSLPKMTKREMKSQINDHNKKL